MSMSSLRHSRDARKASTAARVTGRFALKRGNRFQVRTIDGFPRDCRDREKPSPFHDYEIALKTARFLNGQLQADDVTFEVVDYPAT
jgi:hypothetical protein